VKSDISTSELVEVVVVVVVVLGEGVSLGFEDGVFWVGNFLKWVNPREGTAEATGMLESAFKLSANINTTITQQFQPDFGFVL